MTSGIEVGKGCFKDKMDAGSASYWLQTWSYSPLRADRSCLHVDAPQISVQALGLKGK